MFWVRGPEPLDTDAVNEKEKKEMVTHDSLSSKTSPRGGWALCAMG